MTLVHRAFIVLFVLVFAGLQHGIAREEILREEYVDFPDTLVEIESVFGTAARQGALPFRVRIRNNSGEDRDWTVTFSEGNSGRPLTTKSAVRIPVEDGSEVVREVSLPFAPAFLAYDYRNLAVSVDAPGLPPLSRSRGAQTNQLFPTLAISMPLARRSLTNLDDAVKTANHGDHAFAKAFESGDLPGSWQAYTGLDALLIDLPSWESLSLSQRQALISWVRLGGRVDVYTDTDATISRLQLPEGLITTEKDRVGLSLGEISLRRWDGIELGNDVIGGYRDLSKRSRALEEEFSANWELQNEFGIREFNPTIIFLLLVSFAILVAPVNLFYFAGQGRRHRLFVTTPLISIATCLIVVAVILLIDGFGGRGIRVVLADLQPAPGEMRLYLSQEQISRTGVMTSTGFSAKADYDINPVSLPASGFNQFRGNTRNSTTYEFGQEAFRGGFFQSRSEQGFSLRSVEATRARIQVDHSPGNGTAPTLISNIPQPLTHLLYIDKSGDFWVSSPGQSLAPGAGIPLEKAPGRTWPAWIEEPKSRLSETFRGKVDALRGDRNRFFAVPATHDDFALPTHPAIEWEKTFLILTGTPVHLKPSADTPALPPVSLPDSNE